jgi:hypothetical protein
MKREYTACSRVVWKIFQSGDSGKVGKGKGNSGTNKKSFTIASHI